ncbi:hypothetical protein [Paenibacillus terrigena]|uniref:hypothetical protein n=1 Tax=Paenibacillus terrigena TaxID=369333 RepID=UPI0028D35058|nr:hypothetical protein [Paenibacillus terrigena]
MEPQVTNIEQRLTNLNHQINALDEKLNVILEFCLKQNGFSQDINTGINDLHEEIKSIKMMAILNQEHRPNHSSVVNAGGFSAEITPSSPQAVVSPRKICPECGAVDQMQQIKDTLYDEHGNVLRADAPALECQICGEIVHI